MIAGTQYREPKVNTLEASRRRVAKSCQKGMETAKKKALIIARDKVLIFLKTIGFLPNARLKYF